MSVHVGMADMKVAKGSETFVCIGLGSCIGVAALDPVAKVGGMLHVMLPEAFGGDCAENPAKFADTGVPAFVERLEAAGARRSRLRVALAGGAQVFQFGDDNGGRLQIGVRNAMAVTKMLAKLGLKAVAQDVGGTKGRTLILSLETGEVRLRALKQEERSLCSLAS